MTTPHDSPDLPDDHGPNDPQDRIDADPPYGPAFPEKIKFFREFLAALIARRILADRQGTNDSNNGKDS